MTRSSNVEHHGLSRSRWSAPRMWLAGAVIIAAAMAGAGLLLHAGFFITSIIYAVLCGLGLTFLSVFAGDDEGGGYVIAGLCGLLICVSASLAGSDEVRLFGSSAYDVVAANASASGATFLHFRDARVLSDQAISVAVMGQSSGKEKPHLLYYLRVAPIVDGDWTEGAPIGALAVVGSPQLGHEIAEWRAPLNGGVRVNGEHLDEQAAAVRNLIEDEHLNIASNAVFVRWSATPEREATAARSRIWIAYLIALAFWTVTVLVNFIVFRARNNRRIVS